ncbi:unnamed protein product [Rangifer tarandus platyrhynchus]|uniref:Uncharacterized protein n=2 Tax=Rangifer tarandus platyrhynchus TaxID=3082113 RepID=A0ABN8YXQ6_RANTA|nr:unnamed protein product [Rangifer tarandus platyrhynchus]CAI9694215.1 unnamed protein product [Rangifer tarandus platyrhynchus]
MKRQPTPNHQHECNIQNAVQKPSSNYRPDKYLTRAEICRRGQARVDTARWGARLSSSPRRVTPRDSSAETSPGRGRTRRWRKPGRAPRPCPGRLRARRPPRAARAPDPGPEGERPFTCAPALAAAACCHCHHGRAAPHSAGEPTPAHSRACAPRRDPDPGDCGPGTRAGTAHSPPGFQSLCPRKLISAKARPTPRLSLNAHRRVTSAQAKREPQAPSFEARHSWLLWSSERFRVKQVDSGATSCWLQLLVHLNDRP